MNKSQQMLVMNKFSSSNNLVQERKPLGNRSPSIARKLILDPFHNKRTQRRERVNLLRAGPHQEVLCRERFGISAKWELPAG